MGRQAAELHRAVRGLKDSGPDCVYLGGINDNNGEQLIKDKVAVLGPNNGTVKLIAPDGFTGYPTVQELAEAQGMYITFAGLPARRWSRPVAPAPSSSNDFKAKYGHDPASAYAIYGAAAMQFILAAIAESDGTRKGVRDAAFSRQDHHPRRGVGHRQGDQHRPETGDVTVRDMSIQLMTGQRGDLPQGLAGRLNLPHPELSSITSDWGGPFGATPDS